MASSRTGTLSKPLQLLEAAVNGNLRRFKNIAAELSDGRGLARTIASVKNTYGLSALHFAAVNGHLDICKYLIDDLKLDVDPKDGKGDTPLFLASLDGHLHTAAYLLEKGANPGMKNDSGFTPLHYVAYEGHKGVLNLLLSRGVDVNALSDLGSPLHRAAGVGKHEVVKILLDHNANPNITFHSVFTPLSSSILASSLPCLRLLIEAGADPNAGSCGVTPLNLAVTEGEIEMIKCLLKAGADPDVTDEHGMRPIEIAALNRRHEAVQILYPLTTPIRTYPDWSIGGIMRLVHSEDARRQRNLKVNETFEEIKSKGEDAFRKKEYLTAILWYTRAIEADPSNAFVLSNRSLCWARLKGGDRALSDAEACILLKPEWPKAYYRAGASWIILKKFDQAIDAFSMGLKQDPGNKELQNAIQEALEAKMKSM